MRKRANGRRRHPRAVYAAIPVSIDGHAMPSLGAWAEAAQVDTSTVAKLIKGQRDPRGSTAEKLAAAIGVSTGRLLEWLHEVRNGV